MRMRHKPYARAELESWPRFSARPEENKGHWKDNYANKNASLHLEVGCGKGGFLSTMALQNPTMNYLGIDIKNEMLLVAKRTTEKTFENAHKSPDNILFTAYNIEKLLNILDETDGVERIYINFCNPWYKTGHAKHRLTHPRQLAIYRRLLQPGGEIQFKTDDDPLFKDSMRYFPMAGFEVVWATENLHLEEPAENVRTEHEEMFAREGLKIKACYAKMVPADLDFEALSRLKDI